MKTQRPIAVILLVLSVLFMFLNGARAQYLLSQKVFDPNNARTYFANSGIFNQNCGTTNQPGFMWPKGSNKFAVFTSGLNIAALVHDSLRMAAASYKGEYRPGYTTNCTPYTDTNFHIYSVKRGDNAQNNPDFANWGAMVPFGAPYYDVNNNGQYDQGIDTPGVRYAAQTIFIALTDGFLESHSGSEGFGGGTPPLYADLRITAWGYNIAGCEDMQFVKFQIINKNVSPWTHTFVALFADPDLGNPDDDYSGCDTSKKLCYCYNAAASDLIYGSIPPAVGFVLLKGLVNHSIVPNVNIGMTSFVDIKNETGLSPSCEWMPTSAPEAYNRMKGLKNDGAPYYIPIVYPHPQTKFLYSGDPESGSGWSQYRGYVSNCGTDTGTVTQPQVNSDVKFLISMGSDNLTMAQNDTQIVIISQLIAKGSSNKNSVTVLRGLANSAQILYSGGFDLYHSVSGNVKYLDNNQNVILGSVKAFNIDLMGNIYVLDSAGIQTDGSYQLNNVPGGDCYIGAVPNSTTQTDYVLTYYPATIYYQNATLLIVNGNLSGINVKVYRKTVGAGTNTVNGRVTTNQYPYVPLKGTNVYALSGSTFIGYTSTDSTGVYHLSSLSSGSVKILVNRIGYGSDSTMVNITNSIIDSVNFRLTRIYISVNPISSEVPDKYMLYQNYPNPFNPNTVIKFQIKESKFTTLKIFNILGKEVAALVSGKLNAGTYEVAFDGTKLPSGVYFYRLSTETYSQTKRMMLLK